MSAKFTAEINIFYFNWKSPTVRFILLTWVKFLKKKQKSLPKVETNQNKTGRVTASSLILVLKLSCFSNLKKSSSLMTKLSKIFQNGENSRVKDMENLEKNWLCLCHFWEKSTVFHMIQVKNRFMKLRILDKEIVFLGLQVNIYYKRLFMKKWMSLKYSTENWRNV